MLSRTWRCLVPPVHVILQDPSSVSTQVFHFLCIGWLTLAQFSNWAYQRMSLSRRSSIPITIWYAAATAEDKLRVQWIVSMKGSNLPTFQDTDIKTFEKLLSDHQDLTCKLIKWPNVERLWASGPQTSLHRKQMLSFAVSCAGAREHNIIHLSLHKCKLKF